jgi:hypothetical protein
VTGGRTDIEGKAKSKGLINYPGRALYTCLADLTFPVPYSAAVRYRVLFSLSWVFSITLVDKSVHNIKDTGKTAED